MTKDDLTRGNWILSTMNKYIEYKDVVGKIMSNANIPVYINPANTPLTSEDSRLIMEFIVDLCTKRISQFEQDFENL